MKLINRITKNKTRQRVLKALIILLVFFLVTELLVLIPGIKTDTDYLYYLANSVKTELFEISPEINTYYKSEDLIFTFKNYTYKKTLTGMTKKEGLFQYKVNNADEILCVNWETDAFEKIIITRVVQKQNAESKIIYTLDSY